MATGVTHGAGEAAAPRPARRVVVPAVGPRLRRLLVAVLLLVAVIGANSAYLAAITAVEWFTGRTYQNWLYQWMFLVHLVLGFAFIAPFVVFGLIHMANTRHRKNAKPSTKWTRNIHW